MWDKHSRELIGFVDLGDIHTNFATLKNVQNIVNPLSFSFCTFATAGATSAQIMPIFWKAVCYLEGINLKVIGATADAASYNRKFFRMHKNLADNTGKNVVYRTKNICTKEERFIYFFADVPETVFQILVQVGQQDLCGIVELLFFGPIFQIYIMKIWKVV